MHPCARVPSGARSTFPGAGPQRESKSGASTMSAMLFGLDPKPGELPMARLKPG